MQHGLARWATARLWIVLMLGASAPAAYSQSSGERLLQSAHALLGRGLHEQAIAEYQDAIDLLDEPQQIADARYGQAIALSRIDNTDDAISLLRAIPADLAFAFRTDADVLLTTLLAQNGQLNDAREMAERVLPHTDHASWPRVAALHVELFHRLGQHRDALRAFRNMESVLHDKSAADFAHAALFAGLAAAHVAESEADFAVAAQLLERCLSDSATEQIRDHAFLTAANMWQNAEDPERVERILRRALREGSDSIQAETGLKLGGLLRAAGNPEDATQILGDARRAETDSSFRARVDLELGLAQLDAGNARQAARAFDRVLETEENTLLPIAAYWRAKADLRRERFDQAAERLGDAIKRYPESPLAAEAIYDLGVAHQRAGKPLEAYRAFQAFRTHSPRHSLIEEAHAAEIAIAVAEGMDDDAITLARDFLQKYPTSEQQPRADMLLGEALFNAERFAEAAEHLHPFSLNDNRQIAQRAMLVRGLALHADNRSSDALPVLAAACESMGDTPATAPAHFSLAQIHSQQASWPDALDAATAFLRVAPQDDPTRAHAHLILAVALARTGANEEAVATLHTLLATHIHNDVSDDLIANARLELGRLYRTSGSDQLAADVLDELVEQQPDSRFAPHAIRILASIAADAGDTDKADTLYRRAISSDQSDVARASILDLARTLLETGKNEQAAELLSSTPDNLARAIRAIALGRAGRHTEATDLAQHIDAPSLPNDLADSYTYQIADSERQSGDVYAATKLLRSLLDSPHVAAHASLKLADLALEQNDVAQAIDILENATRLESADTEDVCASIRYQLAWCRYQTDDPRAAITLLEASPCDMDALAAPAALLLGEAYAALSQNSRAAEQFTIALEHDLTGEEHDTALLRLGETSAAAQQWHESRQAFIQHREEHADSERWFIAEFGIGWATENIGQQEDAMRHYRAVTNGHHGETAARAQFQIGECLFALSRHEEAVRELLRVDTMHNEPRWSAAALFEAGRCFEAMNKVGEARAQYRLVVQQHPDSHWAEAADERLRSIASPGGS